MKTLSIILSIFLSSLSFSQNDQFMQKMGETLGVYAESKTPQDFLNVAFKFEQIASVETENWLPLYYYSMCYIMASYGEKADDAVKKDAHLAKAQTTIETLKKMAPIESEIYALEGLYYTAVLSVNTMERGQKYSALSMATLEKALALDPKNPRAKQLKISNEFGIASFFGTDQTPICERAKQLISDWDNYEIKSPIHPNWGKSYLIGIAKSCDQNNTNSDDTKTEDTTQVTGHSISIKIDELNSNNGVVLLELMDEDQQTIRQTKGDIKNNSCIIEITGLEPGNYAIQYFHDENMNMKMDQDQYGRPTEGYGFSNNARGFMSAPKINKMLFPLNKDLNLSLKTRN